MFTIIRNEYLSQALLSLFLLGLLSCCRDDDPCTTCPPPHTPTIALTIDDVGVTDAWLKLESVDSTALGNVLLMRDTIQVLSATILARDTIILDEGLLPKKHYTYKAYRMDGTARIDSSLALRLITNDSSSSAWTWTFDTLGNGNASTLKDVCIVNDTLAYAVGRIEILDSSNNFVLHNLAVWNGITWKMKKIGLPLYGFNCEYVVTRATPLYAIYQFPSNIIIISNGGSSTAILNGDSVHNYPCIPQGTRSGGLTKLWGISENDFYAVGGNGTLIRYLNGEWKKIESGTSYDIQDIWGAENPGTGEMEILAVVAGEQINSGKHILKISGDSVSWLPDNGLPQNLSTIWFEPGKQYYTAGNRIWKKTALYSNIAWAKTGEETVLYHTESLRANGRNDIAISGHFGETAHFNGLRWKKFYITGNNGIYHSVAIRGNVIIAVGENNSNGIIAIGKR